MFSTLLGALPPVPGEPLDAIRRNVADLEATGLELLADGLPAADLDSEPAEVVARWRAAAGATSRPVKQSIVGPGSAAAVSGSRGRRSARSVADHVRRARAIIEAVLAAGCPFIEIAETAVTPESLSSRAARNRFVAAHRDLLHGLGDAHVSLALGDRNLDTIGAATFFELPYASYAFDLIAGPDNWRLIAAAPTDRGVICGALNPRPGGDESRELLVWAAQYAASTGGRGIDRVGLSNAWSLDAVPRDVALHKLTRIAEASQVAAVQSAEELARLLDPRAFARRRRPGSVRLAGPDDD